MSRHSRREFLEFLGGAGLLALTTDHLKADDFKTPFHPLMPTRQDDLVLAGGLSYRVLVRWEDKINAAGETFGFNNDYIATLPAGKADEAWLWVNHETAATFFVGGYARNSGKQSREQVITNQKAVGGSILKIRRDAAGDWFRVRDDAGNRRISGLTEIALDRPIEGATKAVGTLANCAGGHTPWGTFLTCEENYYKFYGEAVYKDGESRISLDLCKYGWEKFFEQPPQHYGWVVEINPETGEAVKRIGLGRCAHECATVVQAPSGRVAVYTGDDGDDRCLYKFISDNPRDLSKGTLYVADLKKKAWIPLDLEKTPALKAHFKDQTELLIRTREAAQLVGGTPLDRPEDIEVAPNGDVFVCLTNNHTHGRPHGSIMKLTEKGADPLALTFDWDTFLVGGPKHGFSCPDNLCFDRRGNIWLTCDISENDQQREHYQAFGNNGLFYIPLSGAGAGGVYQVASAPIDAELTGPCFSLDGGTLFLSVQHPGSKSTHQGYTSHWPDGVATKPRPSVVAIRGPLLDRLTGA